MNSILASEIAQIRADAAALLDLPCIVQRATGSAPDGTGQQVATLATITTCNAGMSLPTAGQLANFDYLIASMNSWQVKLPYGTNVLEEDLLTIAGQVLTVHVVMTPRSYAALMVVLAVENK